MVILEYRNAAGQITESLPSTQQIDQYRLRLAEPPEQAAQAESWG